VRRNFDRIYAEEPDPWAIGTASDPRYDRYRDLLLARVRGGSLLDIGCGLGAFLARFQNDFDSLTGVETAGEAVRRATAAYPAIEFVHSPAEHLAETALDAREFDAIVLSDVIYYLPQQDRARLVEWVADHLAPGGRALVAAWCPGGRYLAPSELRALVRASLRITDDLVLPTEHVALVCERKRRLVALTFEQDMGAGAGWERSVFQPTDALLTTADSFPVTLFARMDDFARIERAEPGVARRLEAQWRSAVGRGHDVQLELRPEPANGVNEAVAHGAQRLTEIVSPANPAFRVSCFRAAAVQHRPSDRLVDALANARILADSSVYSRDASTNRPRLTDTTGGESIVELPIASAAGAQLTLDGVGVRHLPERAVAASRETAEGSPETLRRRRHANRLLTRVGLGRLVPESPSAPTAGHEYLVVRSYAGEGLEIDAVGAATQQLLHLGFEIVTLAKMATIARADLEETASSHLDIPSAGRHGKT
jgi:SAM-dependent methyltransferase